MTSALGPAVAELDGAVNQVLLLGPPGAHLAVQSPELQAASCAGLAESVGADGRPLPTQLQRRVTPDAWHDLGSVTKLGTTAMVMTLVATGLVDLDAPVSSVIPEFVHRATPRDLLLHRGGLWEWWPTYLTCHCAEDAVRLIGGLELRYEPRTGRHYSDLGFMLLGELVRRVTGTDLPAALTTLVPDFLAHYAGPPPGLPVAASSIGDGIERRMVQTGEPYPVPVDASGFTGWRRRVLVGEVNDGNAFHTFGGVAGHAGLFAPVSGLLTFGRSLLAAAGGDGRWPAAAIGEFLTPGPDDGQLLGFRQWTSDAGGCSATAIGHTGFPGIGFAVIPEHQAVVVLATNRLHVAGPPAPFDPMWRIALDAAHHVLHENH